MSMPNCSRSPFGATLARNVSSESLRRAAELLAAGDWTGAHAIVQDDPSPLAAWMHGVVHLLEGDASNARNWYGRAGRAFPLRKRFRRRVHGDAVQERVEHRVIDLDVARVGRR
jgi:hypothetical protein